MRDDGHVRGDDVRDEGRQQGARAEALDAHTKVADGVGLEIEERPLGAAAGGRPGCHRTQDAQRHARNHRAFCHHVKLKRNRRDKNSEGVLPFRSVTTMSNPKFWLKALRITVAVLTMVVHLIAAWMG